MSMSISQIANVVKKYQVNAYSLVTKLTAKTNHNMKERFYAACRSVNTLMTFNFQQHFNIPCKGIQNGHNFDIRNNCGKGKTIKYTTKILEKKFQICRGREQLELLFIFKKKRNWSIYM